ncbi:HTH-type transcriptional regulator HdfR [uncultured Cedecea sp.]|uniref:HTH-type transcriptional regulator HdfR n=1 Tax=uncultured Cedecea sp. TaxID=988762 RepID=UPI00260A90DB|nr:HTH-type transcriptional regulator HdfR [uncultured Cedecea sp.]
MDSELLKTFLEVSRTRHFGRAAETLYLTQSAVSFRIRQLENQLGVNLFTRHRNNIRLTTAGERLLPYAENLMSTWLAAKKEVSLTSQHNQLSIGASAALWECMLTPWLSLIYQQYKDFQFDARIAPRQSLVQQLHDRRLDLLLTTEAPKMDEFTSQLLGNFNLALYAGSPEYDRNTLSYVRIEWGADFQQYESEFIQGEEIPLLTTSSASQACQLILPLNGYAFLPVEWAKQQKAIYPLADSGLLTRPLYAIWLQNTDKQSIIKSLLKTPLLAQ